MKEEIEHIFSLCNNLINHCDIDYNILINSKLDNSFFTDYNNTRVVNSFLFNFSKLQDKIGGKLFKKILYVLKEIDTFELTMIDVLNHLERLNIIASQEQLDELREIRNTLAHEYPMCETERIENTQLALEGYATLKKFIITYWKLIMRLSKFEQNAIKQTFEEVFKEGEIYLFGSRVNNTKKGGDIDLYIKVKTENFQRKKINLLVKLKKLIGDHKIDIVRAK